MSKTIADIQDLKTSSSFTLPPGFFDFKVTIPAAWDFHAQNSPNHPLFVYEDDGLRTISWQQANRATHRAGHLVQNFVSQNLKNATNSSSIHPPVIGILAVHDPLTYWALVTGVMRAGYTCFVISHRNSPAALTHLLKATKCQALFVSSDEPMQSLSHTAIANADQDIAIGQVPDFTDFFMDSDGGEFVPLPTQSTGPDSMDIPALITHSSGSTSFPKPITVTHRTLIQFSLTSFSGDSKKPALMNRIAAVHALPLFHLLGLAWTTLSTTATGVTASVFRPSEPPILPTSENILSALVKTGCDIIAIVPSIIETWVGSEDTLSTLAAIPKLSIQWSGGPLSQEAGDRLTERGVAVNCLYGMTEIGVLSTFDYSFLGENWRYFQISPRIDVYLEPYGDDLYKAYVLSTQTSKPVVTNCIIQGVPAYDTNDLLTPHPTKEGYWRIHGRADDQIMHSTGEKTNPGPLENIMRQHPSVQACLMFGRGEFQTGVLIEPKFIKQFDPADNVELARFRNEIWPTVEVANHFAPKHSRIFKEMIVITNPSKPLLMTDKGTLKRQPNIDAYANEIKAAYAALHDSARQDIAPPDAWDVESITNYVRQLIQVVMEKSVQDHEDIFLQGADSLQATSIRNSIIKALKGRNQDALHLGQDLVYSHPTITSLAVYISKLVSGDSSRTNADVSNFKVNAMMDMVKEFSNDFPLHIPSQPAPKDEVILVTGTTGAIGSHVLEKLIATPSVGRIYALNRPDTQRHASSKDRQRQTFQNQGIDVSSLLSPKLVFLEGDTTLWKLGLPDSVYEELKMSVTGMIHCAWRVDFNLPLPYYKTSVRGVRVLVGLSLSSPFPTPPPVVFISSISSLAAWTKNSPVPEDVLDNPRLALGTGYGESKWVSERILQLANEQRNCQNVVVRLGQVCGNTRNGNWNKWEWFPAIVESHKMTKCLPGANGVVTWIPSDVAGASIVEMRSAYWSFMHLVHPKPVSWATVIQPVASNLGVPVVPYDEWFSRLQQFSADAESQNVLVQASTLHPALRLLDFYSSARGHSTSNPKGEAFSGARLETFQSVKVSKALAQCPSLSEKDVEGWLKYWVKETVI